jgi:8-oxo-dGTP pyrophosphatase MutT (NUDIX family)
MEMGETVEEGAAREAWEEARARIRIEGVLAVYSIARIGQVQVIFRAHLDEPGFERGRKAWRSGCSAGRTSLGTASPSRRSTGRCGLGGTRRTRPLAAPALNPPSDPRGHAPLAGHGVKGP